jgi:cysteine desulfurase
VLAVRQGTRLQAIVDGGGQERDLRSGTHNVAGIVGMAAAWAVTAERQAVEIPQVAGLRDRLAEGLRAAIADVRLNGDPTRKVANNCHLTVPGVESEALLLLLDREGVDAAAGSSCASGAANPSHVLAAMGISAADARSSLRLSLGWCSTEAEVDEALAILSGAVTQLRSRTRQPA